MAEAIAGIADERDEDAAILSQENGKIRFEGWIDALVFEIRWNLALMLADEVDTGKTLPVDPRCDPGVDRGDVPAARRRDRDRAVQLADRDPRRVAAARAARRQHRDRQAAALGAARDDAASIQRVAEKLPPGVLNVVTGKDENMTGLIQNTDIAKVCFTGSRSTAASGSWRSRRRR